MNETHNRLWAEWYTLWHEADASKPKPSYEEWLETRIEVQEADNRRLVAEHNVLVAENRKQQARIEALELDLARIQNDRELWRGEMGVLQCRIEVLEKQTRLMAGTLSTFGRYSMMHPDEVLAEFAALAGKE